MTPEEYLKDKDAKPLSDQEIKRGKKSLRVFGTDDPMPWDEIYTRIAAGMSMEDIAHIYGHGRKIALWAIKDKIELNPTISDALDSEITQRRTIQAIGEQNPIAAQTIQDMANEYAPDSAKKASLLADKLIQAGSDVLDREVTNKMTGKKAKAYTSLDLVNISKALQTSTDVLGLTQRHASATQIGSAQIQVSGFTFALDEPQDQLPVIDAQVLPDNN